MASVSLELLPLLVVLNVLNAQETYWLSLVLSVVLKVGTPIVYVALADGVHERSHVERDVLLHADYY